MDTIYARRADDSVQWAWRILLLPRSAYQMRRSSPLNSRAANGERYSFHRRRVNFFDSPRDVVAGAGLQKHQRVLTE